MVNNYTPIDNADDIEEGTFDYQQYGKTVYRNKDAWKDIKREDYIFYEHKKHESEFKDNIRIGMGVAHGHKAIITGIVQKYWDCFCKEGAKRPILNYEFAIDTGNAKPVCCRKPRYGPYESKIMMEQIEALLKNDWIERCEGPWGSSIVLAAKPHQENVK